MSCHGSAVLELQFPPIPRVETLACEDGRGSAASSRASWETRFIPLPNKSERGIRTGPLTRPSGAPSPREGRGVL